MLYDAKRRLLRPWAVIGLFCLSNAGIAAPLTPIQQLGKSIFFDGNLSSDGTQSCSFCHDPAQGFTSSHGDFNAKGAVIEGAVKGRFGNRKPPSAAYAAFSPVLHHILDDGDVTFVGGAFLDGRATGGNLGTPTADQAQGPFLNPLEMAMPHAACVVARVLNPTDASAYPVSLTDVWGNDVAVDIPAAVIADCANPDAKITIADEDLAAEIDDAFGKIAIAVSAFEDSSEVNPFSSRYDAWAAGKGTLTEEELAGFDLFNAEDKGNCAACHVLAPTGRSTHAIFTDWTFDNLGVPRNRDNPFYGEAADNPKGKDYVDEGLGGFLKTDPVFAAYADANMARQQVPTLRNLTKLAAPGTPKGYMHNGYFKTLEGVMHFYNTRDVLPKCADPLASEAEAMAQKCWPEAEYPATVNHDELGNLKLTADEEAKIVAFMKTLDDQ